MTWLAVPLYARSQGLSNAEIGLLFAAPVLAQAPLNLVGGAYTDRIGGRRIMLGSCCVVVVAGPWFILSPRLLELLARQNPLLPSPATVFAAARGHGRGVPGVGRPGARR